MDEYHINGLTIKENLLQLAENGNKKFTESLHPGIENVLGIRIPALRILPKEIHHSYSERFKLLQQLLIIGKSYSSQTK